MLYEVITTTIAAGLGYTMKGSGVGYPPVGLQNYSLLVKPNNNTITNVLSPGYNLLTGNPYPSAIDADQFIKDNIPLLNPNGSSSVANPDSSESTNGTRITSYNVCYTKLLRVYYYYQIDPSNI